MMGDWIVEKMPNEEVRPWVHDDYREADMLKKNRVPGRDFVKVSDVGKQEDAESQAKAYFDGTHQAPQRIDNWAQEAAERQKDMQR